jgi:hypothetical protein
MQPKTYIVIVIILIVVVLTYHANIFGLKKELFTAQSNIVVPNNTNIDNLDIKQLKNIVKDQQEVINKQSTMINSYIEKTEKQKARYNTNVVKPNEDIDAYFKSAREENDKVVQLNQIEEDNKDIDKYYKSKIEVVKTYLEDPLMRGSNIYESEQYSKLLEIGNIQLDNKISPPNPARFSKSINMLPKQSASQPADKPEPEPVPTQQVLQSMQAPPSPSYNNKSTSQSSQSSQNNKSTNQNSQQLPQQLLKSMQAPSIKK